MINENELPKGWAVKKLRDVCERIFDGTHFSPKNYPEGTYKYITAKNIKEYGIELSNVTYVTEEDHRRIYERCDVRKNDVLYIKDGATTGIATVNNLEEEFSLLSSVAVFRVNQDIISPQFLAYFLNSKVTRNRMLANIAGVAITRLTLVKLKDTDFIIAPIEEQKRIVAKIEKLFSELDAGLKSLETAQEQLKIYRQAVLKYAFEGKLTEEWRYYNQTKTAFEELTEVAEKRKQVFEEAKKKGEKKTIKNYDFTFSESKEVVGWATATLDKLIYIAGRIGWRGLKKDEYKSEGPLFLSVHSLNYGKYVELKDAFHISKERYDESPEIMLQNDDILLCKDGAGIGKIGIIKNLPYEATVNSSLLVIRGLEIFVPEFLFYLLSGPKLQRLVQERVTGSATPHLFQNDIRKFELLIPPIEEQKQIVEEIESRLSV
jgi:type I restriction enzyme S subunit